MENNYSRWVPRHSFAADIEVTDLQSGIRIREQTKDLSLFGCAVETLKLIRKGASVKIRVIHKGAEMEALGRVVYAQAEIGMGIAFTHIEPEDERILEAWIVGLTSISV